MSQKCIKYRYNDKNCCELCHKVLEILRIKVLFSLIQTILFLSRIFAPERLNIAAKNEYQKKNVLGKKRYLYFVNCVQFHKRYLTNFKKGVVTRSFFFTSMHNKKKKSAALNIILH